MKDKINGICVDNKFYKAVRTEEPTCNHCAFLRTSCNLGVVACEIFKEGESNNIIFKFSQELTDKLNTNGI